MTEKKTFNLISICFVLILFFIFLYGLGNYGLLSKDEPRYAGCALEMIENSDFTVPKFNFQDRFDKPALYYWLIATSYKILGVNSFSSRLPSALSAICLILFTWYTSSKVLGKQTGFISALILATSFQYIFLGRRAATDITLTLLFSGSLFSMYLGYFHKDWRIKIFWTVLSGVFAGFALLTKGPVGIVLQFAILTLFLTARKQLDIKHIKVYLLISLVALLVSAPWYIAVHKATNGDFTKVFFFTHNLERFTSVVGEHPGPCWFYIPVILLGFLPWTIFLIPALIKLIPKSKKRINKFILFCLIWVFSIFLFFSLSRTKLATYILLIYPSLAIVTGYWLTIASRKNFNKVKKALIAISIFFIIGLVIAYGLMPSFKIIDIDKVIISNKILISIGLLLIGSIAVYLASKRFYIYIFGFCTIFILSVLPVFVAGVEAYHKITFNDLATYASLAKEKGAKEIISFGGYKPILVYYGRVPVNFDNKWKQVKLIKEKLSRGENVYIIGYLSDIEISKKIIKKNKDIFMRRLNILKSDNKYFLGRIS
jgi:4-amino-4-deoxy-L-arabinose transferase-like glycosyltransferase